MSLYPSLYPFTFELYAGEITNIRWAREDDGDCWVFLPDIPRWTWLKGPTVDQLLVNTN